MSLHEKKIVADQRNELSSEREPSIASNLPEIVVVGAGPVGVRFCNELLAIDPKTRLTLIGNEPYRPYNRVQLTGVLAGSVQRENIDLKLPDRNRFPSFRYQIANIVEIDRKNKHLRDTLDNLHRYNQLVLAVGSRPFVPALENIELTGVYTFRNLKDTDALYARLASTREIAVIGGGLLGIEAAKALSQNSTKVTLIHQADRLMNRQLDEEAASMLKSALEEFGIDVQLNSRVREVIGEHRVESIVIGSTVMNNGESKSIETKLSCNTVIFSTGISVNTQLALQGKLAFGKGIKVNEHLQTNDSNIYAIGECAEYNGETWGLVEPGYDQAAILADRLSGGSSKYLGSSSLARLKVINKDVCSIGDIDHRPSVPKRREIVYRSKGETNYRKILLNKGRIIGALGFGKWKEISRIQEALIMQRKISPLRQLWFKYSGQLWPNDSETDIKQWPSSAIVCQCNGISVSKILSEIDAGAKTVDQIKETTAAGTGCGSCQYLLEKAIGSEGPREKEKQSSLLFLVSILALCVAGIQLYQPGLQPETSVQTVGWFEKIWNDKFYKQVTGFSLLAVIVAASLMSLRKRLRSLKFGDYRIWRTAHGLLGAIAVALVVFHTGFHLGNNFNSFLLFNFIAVILVGALTGVITSQSHRMSLSAAKKLTGFWYWLHIFVTWPLPILLAFHIATVYYF